MGLKEWAAKNNAAVEANKAKAAATGAFEGITLKPDGIKYKSTSGPVFGATAHVETAADARRRITATRVLAIGIFALAAKKQTGNVYLTVEHPDYGFVVEIPVKYQDEDLAVTSRRPVRIGLQKGEKASVTTDVPAEVEGPIRKGQRMGLAMVAVGGDKIGTVALFASTGIEKPSLLDKLMDNVLLLVLALVIVVFAILGVAAFVRRRHQSRMRRRLRRVTRYPR